MLAGVGFPGPVIRYLAVQAKLPFPVILVFQGLELLFQAAKDIFDLFAVRKDRIQSLEI